MATKINSNKNGNVLEKILGAKRAAYYVRVSTEKQESEETIENQIGEIEQRIKKDGHVLQPDCRFQDNGWSGSVLKRPGLDKMRNAAAEGKFKIIYCYDRGRIARKYSYQEIVIEEIEDRGIEFISLKDKAVESEDDRVIQGMQGLFAQWERTKIQERFRLGKMRKVNKGKILGYVPAFGFKYRVKTKDEDGYVEINKAEAKVVYMIFKWVGEDQISLHEVIRRLYKLGIYPRKRKRDVWSKGPILRMLRNTSYIGKHFYNTSEACVSKKRRNGNIYSRLKNTSRRTRPRDEWVEIKFPQIIPNDLFDKVQRRLDKNLKTNKRSSKQNFLLTGFVKCECGMSRTADGPRGHKYYRCTDRLGRFPKPRECYLGGLNIMVLEPLVWGGLVKLITSPDLIQKQAELWLSGQRDNAGQENNDIKEQLALLDQEAERYAIAYGQGALKLDILQKLQKDLERRHSALSQEGKQRASQAAQLPEIGPNELVEQTIQGIRKLNLTEKRFITEKLLEKVIATPKRIAIQGNLSVTERSHIYLRNEDRDCGTAECWQINVV